MPVPFEKMLLEKLKDYEDELVSSLSGVDTKELCDKFFEGCLLSSKSRANFTSLDHSRLKPQLQVRYLVRLASVRIKSNPALGLNLVEVLDTLEGVPSSVADKLKQAMTDINVGPTDVSDTVGGLSATAVGEASKEKDIALTQEDLRLLKALLAKVRDKWEEIASILGLMDYEIADFKGKTNLLSLYGSIEFWICNHSNATLKKLTEALIIVGKRNISEEVKKKLEQKKTEKNLFSESKSATQSRQTPRIVGQSLPTEVADGKSTLLQVQARPRESVVSYQWKKDGQPLANSSRYSGVDEDILVVRHASQGTEGEYMCCINLLDRQVTSNKISLTIHYHQAKKLVFKICCKLKKVHTFQNDWPLIVPINITNMVLLKSSDKRMNETSLSVCGNPDDTIAENEEVEYDEAFGEYKSNEFILVEGRPGSGKTTLAHKLVEDWKSGKVFTNSSLALIISLQNLDTSCEELSDVLQNMDFNKDETEIISEFIKQTEEGEGICFVLDSLDKYKPDNRDKSIVMKLLDRKYLPKSMIIVFSRPSGTEQLNMHFTSKGIQVFGFSKEQLSKYIDNTFSFKKVGDTTCNNSTLADRVKDYLHDHPDIHDMCFLPIFAAMICFYFKYHSSVLASPTDINVLVYEQLLALIIHRHLRPPQAGCIKSLKHLDKREARNFKDLCHLAYDMTSKYKYVISLVVKSILVRRVV